MVGDPYTSPGISLIRANSAEEAGDIMKKAFPKASNLHATINAGNISVTLLKHVGSLLLIYSICRILFYFFNYTYFSGLGAGTFIYLLFISLGFDLSAIVLTNSLFIITAKFKEKNAYFLRILYFSVNSIASLANCIDLAYFRFTLKRTSADALHFLDGDLGTPLPVFLKDYWYIFLINGEKRNPPFLDSFC